MQVILNNNMNDTVRDVTVVFNITEVETVTEELVMISNSSRGSISPTDLDSTITIIDTITMYVVKKCLLFLVLVVIHYGTVALYTRII